MRGGIVGGVLESRGSESREILGGEGKQVKGGE